MTGDFDFTSMFFEELNNKLDESKEILVEIVEKNDFSRSIDLKRNFHTIKGSASMVGLNGFRDLIHKIEDIIIEYEKNPELDFKPFAVRLINVCEKLKSFTTDITAEDFQKILDILEGKNLEETEIKVDTSLSVQEEFLKESLFRLLKIENVLLSKDVKSALREIKQLKEIFSGTLERTAYIPLRTLLKGFDALVLQESQLNNKQVELKLDVGGYKVHKGDSQKIFDALVHLVKNAISHGIESPDVRISLGKSEKGCVSIKAYMRGRELFIEVSDDGRGIDFEKIKKKLEERGLTNIKPEDAIFLPGFSSRDSTDISAGRGVGLEAVKTAVASIGGSVSFTTEKGKGTTFTLVLPVRSFVVQVAVAEGKNGYILAIDSDDIVEVIKKPVIFEGKVRYKNTLYEAINYSETNKLCVITPFNTAVIIDNVLGIFEGQVINTSFENIKGFVKNVFVAPIPIIKVDRSHKVSIRSDKKKYVILFADDSNLTRMMVSKYFELNGFDVIEACDGQEALEKEGYDIAVLDVEMPKYNGIEVARILKSKNPKLPVVLFSTLNEEQIRMALDIPVDSFVSKAEKPEKLIQVIRNLLS